MEMLKVVQLSLLVIPIVFALGFWRGRRRRAALEHQGEALVRRTLTRKFSQAGYHLLNHLTLPSQGGTTEIGPAGAFKQKITVSRFLPFHPPY